MKVSISKAATAISLTYVGAHNLVQSSNLPSAGFLGILFDLRECELFGVGLSAILMAIFQQAVASESFA